MQTIRIKMKYILPALFILITIHTRAQDKALPAENLLQFSGRVMNFANEPISFAHVLVLNNMRGSITDPDGMFSVIVRPRDTVMLTCVGYKPDIIIINDSIPDVFLTKDYILEQDTLMITEVVVYPWKTYEEFKKAFLELELPDTDAERARRNIALLKTQMILYNEPNPSVNFRQVLEQQYLQTFNQGIAYPTYSITNPFAWAKFFKALKDGDFKYDNELKEKNKNYNRKNRQ